MHGKCRGSPVEDSRGPPGSWVLRVGFGALWLRTAGPGALLFASGVSERRRGLPGWQGRIGVGRVEGVEKGVGYRTRGFVGDTEVKDWVFPGPVVEA